MTCVVAFCCMWCMSSCVPGCDMCLPNVVPSWVPHVRYTSEVGRSFTPITLVAARIAVAVSCGSACDSVSLRERSYFGHRSASVCTCVYGDNRHLYCSVVYIYMLHIYLYIRSALVVLS